MSEEGREGGVGNRGMRRGWGRNRGMRRGWGREQRDEERGGNIWMRRGEEGTEG